MTDTEYEAGVAEAEGRFPPEVVYELRLLNVVATGHSRGSRSTCGAHRLRNRGTARVGAGRAPARPAISAPTISPRGITGWTGPRVPDPEPRMCSGTRDGPRGRAARRRSLRSLARFVLDDESIHESLAVSLEVALMPCVGQAGLRAGVGHEPVRLERRDRHRQLAFPPQQPSRQPGRVADGSPARALLEAHEPWPVLRPVRRVRDEGEPTPDGDVVRCAASTRFTVRASLV